MLDASNPDANIARSKKPKPVNNNSRPTERYWSNNNDDSPSPDDKHNSTEMDTMQMVNAAVVTLESS